MYKLLLALPLLLQATPKHEAAINNGAPFLLKSVNADTVNPVAKPDVPSCCNALTQAAWPKDGEKQHNPDPQQRNVVDNSTPHTTTVHCQDGVYGVLINNDSRTVQVTCYEHTPAKK